MSSIDEIRDARIKKLKLLQKKGVNPYPAESKRELALNEAIENFDVLEKPARAGGKKEIKWIAGRIMSIRRQGAIVFITLNDGTGSFQGLLKKDIIGNDKLDFFNEVVDIGDFIEIQGNFFTTKRGEKTLEAKDWHMLSKSLRPLPEKWQGLQDEEIILRKRYLDILTNPETKKLFIDKNKFWSTMRGFLVSKGFLELEMPILESTPGGAEAEPFKTHHNALNTDFHLRISLELPLKKMLVAGYEKVFEIGRIFRNEGISSTHLQDYTQMEFYWAYASFDQLMQFTQEMYQYIIKETFGTLKIYRSDWNIECDWSGTWERKNYLDLFKEWTGINLETAGDGELKKYLDKHKVKYEDFIQRGRLIDLVFKRERRVRSEEAKKDREYQKPFFLINQPIELEPLAKKVDGNPKLVQRMQVMAYYLELGKGFGELNDPIDQRERFNTQMELREKGDVEAQILDEDYLEAMEYGMPSAAGFGLSERLFSVLAGKSVREAQIFPLMRPRENELDLKSKKETKMAVAVLNKEAKMEPWQELNTIAHLNAAFGARVGKGDLFTRDTIVSKDNHQIKLNIKNAIMIKTAPSGKVLRKILAKAKDLELEVDEFTREMIETTSDKKVIEITASKNFDEIEYLGILIYGSKDVVENLTSDLKLY